MTDLIPSPTPQRFAVALRERGWKDITLPGATGPAAPVVWTLPGTDHVVPWEEAVTLCMGGAAKAPKPGWKTTEFWGLLVAMALTADTAQLAVAAGSARDLLQEGAKALPYPWNVILGSLCAILTAVLPIAYRVMREHAKQLAAKEQK